MADSTSVDWTEFYRSLGIPASSGTTQYFNQPGVTYGYNVASGNYEPKRAGEAYASVPAPKFPAASLPTSAPRTAVAAIEQAAPSVAAPTQALALAPVQNRPQATQQVAQQTASPAGRSPLLDALSGSQKQPSWLDMLLSGFGDSNTTPSSALPWWRLEDPEHSGGFDGHGGGGSLV